MDIRVDNIEFSPKDSRDHIFVPVATGIQLPKSVYLINPDDEIEDQKEIGSCTANAFNSALELMVNTKQEPVDLSRLFVYYETRALEGRLGQEGAVLRNVFKVGQKVGVPNESEWDYVTSNSEVKPPQAAYDQALTQKIGSYEAVKLGRDSSTEQCNITINSIKEALNEGLPVVIAMRIYRWFMYVNGPFWQHVMMPTQVDNYMEYIGNHAVTIVGYDDKLNGGSFIIQNSWGTSWGQNGYCAFNYSLVNSIYEAWVVKGFMNSHVKYSIEERMVAELYVGLLNRAPEKSGLDYWVTRLKSDSINSVAEFVYQIPEVRKFYPLFYTNKELITSFYVNVLGRIPDVEGMKFWEDRFESSFWSKYSSSDILVDIMAAVRSYGDVDDSGVRSKSLFENKVECALWSSVVCGIDDIEVAKGVLKTVTHDASSVGATMDRLIKLTPIQE